MDDPPEAWGGLSETDLASLLSGENGAYLEALFEDYLTGRGAVPETWRRIFEGVPGHNGRRLPAAAVSPAPGVAPLPGAGLGLFGLVDAYRAYGHLAADLDPLGRSPRENDLLDPAQFGVTGPQLEARGPCGSFQGLRQGTPRELIAALRETYCGTFAAEFMELRDKARRDWLIAQMEPVRNRPKLAPERRLRALELVLRAERFEQFLHRRFLGQKRFSIEGCEALIPLLDTIVEDGGELGVEEMVIAMAHRGRLNVLAHVLGMPYRAVFRDFHLGLVPLDAQGSGDVRYHRGYSADRTTRNGRVLHMSLQPNPSHLEAIDPVAEGIARAKQNVRGDLGRQRVIPLLIHGDAAFMGQGIVAETLAMSELSSYWTGGTIHIIVNNQIGFTTDPESYCFTHHPSDMAKVIQAPIFHVNADDPEACVYAAKLAIAFRQRYREDVIIDLVCYRRHGHNEGDDPTYTQPLLYQRIAAQTRVGETYTERLRAQGAVDRRGTEVLEARIGGLLERALDESHTQLRLEGAEGYHGLWSGIARGNGDATSAQPDTSVPGDVLREIGASLASWPDDFHPHRKLVRQLRERADAVERDLGLDWGTGEALALGSLLREGTTVRLTGQDSERGTFSHRHAVLHDVEDGRRWVPLAALAADGASFIIANSLLSEAAVLGFEYGYSTVDPSRLVVWEAQFGDFANGAQVIIDQFIACAEQKWNRSSGLVMLLPHGFEGQGPEHSSARLERFLQLCAEDNLQVCNLTTPGQLFHALRRQIHRSFRKPLVIMTPKSLLRHPRAVSTLRELEVGSFEPVLEDCAFADGTLDPGAVRRVLLCSGKVYYTLLEVREDNAFEDVALVRLEEIHPFPAEQLREVLSRYRTRDFAWVQEEPWNMGAWSFVQDRLRRAVPKGGRIRYVGRREAASPASGSYRLHEQEQDDFVREAFARRPRRRAD